MTPKVVKAVRNKDKGMNSELAELEKKAEKYKKIIGEKIEAGEQLSDVYETIGYKYLYKQVWELAIDNLNKSISLGNNTDSVHQRIATAYANRGSELNSFEDFSKAEFHYRKSLEKNYLNNDAKYGLSILLFFKLNKKPEGLSIIKELCDKNKNYYQGRIAYARMLYDMNNKESALNEYRNLYVDMKESNTASDKDINVIQVNINQLMTELSRGGANDK